MRAVLGLITVFCAFLCAYNYNRQLNHTKKVNEFFCELASGVIHSNKTEMLPFESVFSTVYTRFFEQQHFDSSTQAIRFAKEELSDAKDGEYILSLFEQYLSSGAAEIDEMGEKLTEICKKAYDDI